MAEVKINIKDDGPLLVNGPIILLDAEGQQFPTDDSACYLCRCGLTATAPFCNGNHKGKFHNQPRAK